MKDKALVSGAYDESLYYQYFLKIYNESMKKLDSEEIVSDEPYNILMNKTVLTYVL